MFYALEDNGKDHTIHAFETLNDRLKWINAQNSFSVAISRDNWLVTDALTRSTVKSHQSVCSMYC